MKIFSKQNWQHFKKLKNWPMWIFLPLGITIVISTIIFLILTLKIEIWFDFDLLLENYLLFILICILLEVVNMFFFFIFALYQSSKHLPSFSGMEYKDKKRHKEREE